MKKLMYFWIDFLMYFVTVLAPFSSQFFVKNRYCKRKPYPTNSSVGRSRIEGRDPQNPSKNQWKIDPKINDFFAWKKHEQIIKNGYQNWSEIVPKSFKKRNKKNNKKTYQKRALLAPTGGFKGDLRKHWGAWGRVRVGVNPTLFRGKDCRLSFWPSSDLINA